jgi:hypothetical protein
VSGRAHTALAASAGRLVRIAIAEAAKQRDLARFHPRGVVAAFVIVALQMQHAVDDEMREMRPHRLPLRSRLPRHDRHAHDDVAGPRDDVIVHERQDVRRVVAGAIPGVEPAGLAGADEAQRDDEAARRGGEDPAAQRRAARQRAGGDVELDGQGNGKRK